MSDSEGLKRESYEARPERQSKKIKELAGIPTSCASEKEEVKTYLAENGWVDALGRDLSHTNCGFLCWIVVNELTPWSYQERCLNPAELGPSVQGDVRCRVADDLSRLQGMYACNSCRRRTHERNTSIASRLVRTQFTDQDVRISEAKASDRNFGE